MKSTNFISLGNDVVYDNQVNSAEAALNSL